MSNRKREKELEGDQLRTYRMVSGIWGIGEALCWLLPQEITNDLAQIYMKVAKKYIVDITNRLEDKENAIEGEDRKRYEDELVKVIHWGIAILGDKFLWEPQAKGIGTQGQKQDEKKLLGERAKITLKHKPMEIASLAEELDTTEDNIEEALVNSTDQFVKLPDGRWGIKATREQESVY